MNPHLLFSSGEWVDAISVLSFKRGIGGYPSMGPELLTFKKGVGGNPSS